MDVFKKHILCKKFEYKEIQIMAVVHYIEERTIVLSQYLAQIPSIDENIKIKGRKGKVLSVKEVEENHFHVHVFLEPKLKNQPISKDAKKKKR
jgi:hypothetical protein